jgi:hypothetical protein
VSVARLDLQGTAKVQEKPPLRATRAKNLVHGCAEDQRLVLIKMALFLRASACQILFPRTALRESGGSYCIPLPFVMQHFAARLGNAVAVPIFRHDPIGGEVFSRHRI